MERITEKQLNALASRLNRLTNSPMEYMTDGKINVGHFHISHAYGGVCLHRTHNEGGGVSTPLSGGHTTKRELYEQMHAFLNGIEFGMDLQTKSINAFKEYLVPVPQIH